jgi:hypothetical protein
MSLTIDDLKGQASSAAITSLAGDRLANIVRALDGAGRMRLALDIVAGRIEIAELTAAQVCAICKVPPTHRARVLMSEGQPR